MSDEPHPYFKFGQRKAHLAKRWEESSEFMRKKLIAVMIEHSGEHFEKEL